MEKDKRPAEPFDFATTAAHQMRAPVAAVSTILDVLLGEYAGPVSPKQRELLERANARCQEALASLKRLLAIAVAAKEAAEGAADMAAVARQAHGRFRDEASRTAIEFSVTTSLDPAWVRGAEPALAEVLTSLVSNALKYTPDHGKVEICVDAGAGGDTVVASVADSGVGVAEGDREKIFHPFFRTGTARGSARPGLGLGLAFVKSVVDGVGGTIRAGKSRLGGAEFIVELPLASSPEAEKGAEGMANVFKVVVIGGVAAGPKVASKIIRLMPEAEVTIVEKGEFLSYAGCGLPYYVSGVVKGPMELMSTPVGVVRDSVFFQKVKNVRVLNYTEALQIDRGGEAGARAAGPRRRGVVA